MTVFSTATPSGHSVFCDDMRMENNGKLMYLGIYNGDMLVESFPTILPVFRIIISYHERVGESSLPVRFVVTAPRGDKDEEIFQVEVPRADLGSAALPDDVSADESLFRTVLSPGFSPFAVTHPGRIKVRAYRGDDEIRLGTLRIRLKSEWQEEQRKQVGIESKEAAN